MGMGQRVRTGLGHGGITYVLQTQFSVVVFFFGGGGGGGQGNMKIILRNKADHKKIFRCCILSYPPIFPLPNTFYGTTWK